ncbi:MAG TPA: hypothetical protein VF767_01565 [Bryobacteraceae bacterium]
MRKKLVLLDLALAAAAVVLALQVRDKWFEARKREQVVLGLKVQPIPPPPYAPLPLVGPLRPADYAGVVEKNLFSPDRNPTVIVEVKAPPPMPDLPIYFGMMNLGDGPMAIMSPKPDQSPREIKFGSKVGEFTLVAADAERVTLEWNGQKIEKRAAELGPRVAGPQPPAAAASPARATPAPQSAPMNVPAGPVEAAPGKDTGGGYRACVKGDNSPDGTVKDGMRKVVTQSPFGAMCRWEPVK